MLSKLPFLFIVFYILITALQFIAGIDGIMHIFGLHWIFAGFAAALLAFIPAIGPAVGLYGAVVVWKWPAFLALFLFFWPYFIYAGLLLFGTTKAFMFWKKALWPFTRPTKRSGDIEPEFTVKEKASTDDAEALPIEYDNR
ncbi:MAG: hypothetical protein IKR09_01575 [Alphaproteobacteria bacterium]|nr:hypothetical protein [Alphaproteobacteria bacterium]